MDGEERRGGGGDDDKLLSSQHKLRSTFPYYILSRSLPGAGVGGYSITL